MVEKTRVAIREGELNRMANMIKEGRQKLAMEYFELSQQESIVAPAVLREKTAALKKREKVLDQAEQQLKQQRAEMVRGQRSTTAPGTSGSQRRGSAPSPSPPA